MRWSRALAPAALVVLALAGCAAPAAPDATPTITAAPPVVDTSPAAIDVTADSVTIRTADGDELDSFDYTTDAPTVVTLLTALFGAEPVTTEVPGLEQPSYTAYNWTGFELQVLAEGSEPYPPLRVKVTVTSVADLLITTIDGLSVGVDADTVAGLYPESTVAFAPPGAALRYAIALGATDGVSVGLEGEKGGPITSIVAPQLG